MEKEPPGLSLDTDTGSNLQELGDAYMSDEDCNEEFDLDYFFTRYEEDSLTPCTNVGIETNSTLYQELQGVSEGKSL